MTAEGTALKGWTPGTPSICRSTKSYRWGTPQPNQISSWCLLIPKKWQQYKLPQQHVTGRHRAAIGQPAWMQAAAEKLSLPLPVRHISQSIARLNQLRLGTTRNQISYFTLRLRMHILFTVLMYPRGRGTHKGLDMAGSSAGPLLCWHSLTTEHTVDFHGASCTAQYCTAQTGYL